MTASTNAHTINHEIHAVLNSRLARIMGHSTIVQPQYTYTPELSPHRQWSFLHASPARLYFLLFHRQDLADTQNKFM